MIEPAIHLDESVRETLNRVSSFKKEVQNCLLTKLKKKCVGFVGDWGVGKDSIALKVLHMEIPKPKLERDHPSNRRRVTTEFRDLSNNPNIELLIRIIPGAYKNREREEDFFDYLRPGDYDFDLLAFFFSLDCYNSYRSLHRKWIPKAKLVLRNTMPYYIIIGTKKDLGLVTLYEEENEYLEKMIDHAYYTRSSVYDEGDILRIRNMIINILDYDRPGSGHSI